MKKLLGAQHSAAHPLAGKIPDRFLGIFVEPSLLEGDDPSVYWNIVSGMIDDYPPQDIFDYIDLHDISKKLWEARACGRYMDAMIRAGKRFAVEQCLSEISPGETELSSKLRENTVPRRAN
ncbi:hypothetical protein JQ621_34795 [Bradyrhizobium manausense]|uniref:hypothetical protein n=1 Tax=Bradyrhizobium manausense TaxID=989370 RepID=UPI001BAAEACF|nr:hypothetical protein [Bradyrhizobium manausense]MBR1092643.1 hypothetical protein [Bradyrhizobium manausense]